MNRNDPRRIAYQLLAAVEFDDAYANLLLPRLLADAGVTGRDAAFTQELAYGTIRWQLFYDEAIEMAAGRHLDDIDRDALIVIRIGAHQLLGMRTAVHAALSETVDLAKDVLPARLTGFVNAVLRRISERTRDDWMQKVLAGLNDEVDRFAIRYSHPVWVVRALKQALKLDGREADLEALLIADNEPAKVSLVALPGLLDRKDLLANEGSLVPGEASPLGLVLESGDPGRLHDVADGSARVQDQGSQLMALALAAAPIDASLADNSWADICAGPGGKAALLAALSIKAEAHLFCNEVSQHRTKLVRNALEPVRQAGANVQIETGDGRALGKTAAEKFDRIMLDAPCSGLGALRRRPEARWRRSSRDIAGLTTLQQELLEAAYAALKPGGVVAYVTCSPHPSETTAVVDWAIKRIAGIELLDANAVLHSVNPALQLNTERKTAQLWPHVNGTDAMFIALLKKPAQKKDAR